MKLRSRAMLLTALVSMVTLLCSDMLLAGVLGKVDDILEGIVTMGRKADPLKKGPVFRQADSFDSLIKRDPDLVASLDRKANKIGDTQSMLQRLNLPPGSKLADEFRSLDPVKQNMVLELASTAQVILRRTDGMDIIQRFDKSGILLVQRFGDNVIAPVSMVVKNDELWELAAKSSKDLGRIDAESMKQLGQYLNSLPKPINLRKFEQISDFNNATRVRLCYETLKKYGKSGLYSLNDLTRRCWDLAKQHPKKAAYGAAIAIIWLEPDIVLDPLGRLKTNAVELVQKVAENIGKFLAEIPVVAAKGLKQGAEKAIREQMPSVSESTEWVISAAGWAITILAVMALLFAIPITRFIPRLIFNKTASLIKKGFQGNLSDKGRS